MELVTINQEGIEQGIKFLTAYLERDCNRNEYRQACTCINILYRARLQEVTVRQLIHASYILHELGIDPNSKKIQY